MDDAVADTLCKRAMVELVFLLAHQRHPKSRERRDWSLLRSLVRDGLALGPRPDELQDGPWHIGQRPDSLTQVLRRWCLYGYGQGHR